MSTTWDFKCDNCGELATHAAKDFHTVESEKLNMEYKIPVGDKIKYGCDLHPVESLERGKVLEV